MMKGMDYGGCAGSPAGASQGNQPVSPHGGIERDGANADTTRKRNPGRQQHAGAARVLPVLEKAQDVETNGQGPQW